ncbi:MAG: AMP-dependent synthetase/ligase [Gammaproteobacteria bacterium]
MPETLDNIVLGNDGNLCELLRERLKRSPDDLAYLQYVRASKDWQPWTWRQFAGYVTRWQQALVAEGLQAGDRVAVMLPNCPEWAALDLAAQGLGLVVVPLYVNDRAENSGLILEDCGAEVLLTSGGDQWQALAPVETALANLRRIIAMGKAKPLPGGLMPVELDDWLPSDEGELRVDAPGGDALASIVYTSGTMGRPKGVMLSHRNILANVFGVSEKLHAYREDVFLSFLPLSHMLERTGGLYLPIASGAAVAYARAPRYLAQDLASVKPTVIICVPRVFEAIYAKVQGQLSQKPAPVRLAVAKAAKAGWDYFQFQQGKAKWQPKFIFRGPLDRLIGPKVRAAFGGKLRCAVAGGAAMPSEIACFFIGAGVPVLHGYGATESAPVVAVNTFESNIPESVGQPLAETEVKLGQKDELLTRGPSVMMGYWNNPEATAKTIDTDGWLHTGDQARIDDGHVYITGRLKEIIVLGNGENVSPVDMEQAVCLDPMFNQVMVIGDGKPNLAALVVLEPEEYERLAKEHGFGELGTEVNNPELKKLLVQRIAEKLKDFPGYAKIPRIALMSEPWTVESGLITPTLKLKRAKIVEANQAAIDALYPR